MFDGDSNASKLSSLYIAQVIEEHCDITQIGFYTLSLFFI